MEGLTVVISIVALAVGFAVGVFIEYLAANAYISAQRSRIKRLKYEMEALKAKGGTKEVIEINDNRSRPESYFIPF